jgi:C4-dicarboxylate-specific signal transduction histidine kinase
VTVKQLLVLYATLFMFLIAAVVVTVAGVSLVQASRRAYRRAIGDEMRGIATEGSIADVRSEVRRRMRVSEVELAVVTSTTVLLGVDATIARDAVEHPNAHPSIICARVEASPTEAYVVARIDPSIPFSIGIVELTRRMVPFALLGAIGCAAFLAFMIGRVFLPPLLALAQIARDPGIREDGLVSDRAPNEILEVASTFRRTLRQLKEERELIASQKRELEAMQANLVRASKLASVGRLAAGIAHEIGNPLAAVQGYLALIPRLDHEEQKEVIDRSAKELQRIHETIRKLLTYARQDVEHTEHLPISLHHVVLDAILLVRGHPVMRPVEIQEELPKTGGPEAIGDAGRLGQVLVNLLLNAAQAMDGAPRPMIRISERLEDGIVELDVEDNGPGVAPDKREQIFDPFYTTKAPGEGTGLGLAVSRSLIESMEGDLSVGAAKSGQGACFTIRLKRV